VVEQVLGQLGGQIINSVPTLALVIAITKLLQKISQMGSELFHRGVGPECLAQRAASDGGWISVSLSRA
jgi:hypothetical protein